MKLQLDLELKTITIEETINLDELVKQIKKLFPDNQWKEYSLKVGQINNWINPIVIKEKEYVRYYPWITPNISPYTQPFWYSGDYVNTGTLITNTNLSIDYNGEQNNYNQTYNIQID